MHHHQSSVKDTMQCQWQSISAFNQQQQQRQQTNVPFGFILISSLASFWLALLCCCCLSLRPVRHIPPFFAPTNDCTMKVSLFLSFYVVLASFAEAHLSFRAWGKGKAPSLVPRGGSSSSPNVRNHQEATAQYVTVASVLFDKAKNVFPQSTKQKAASPRAASSASTTTPSTQDMLQWTTGWLRQQERKAAERRDAYAAADLTTTASTTLTDPKRALKWAGAALVLAEAMPYLEHDDPSGILVVDQVVHHVWVSIDDAFFRLENFCKVGLQPGGLLRLTTWIDRDALSGAVQKQVLPKYQWALGTAFGFVVSPLLWSLGWAAAGWSVAAYAAAESHNWAKRQWDGYYTTLQKTDNPLLFFVDDLLEDMREWVQSVVNDPTATILAMRLDLVERRDNFDFGNVALQRGLVFGAVAGLLAGA
jgi:hypothetical protein